MCDWGPLGSGDGQFNNPLDIAVGADRDVYISDTDNHRIQKFDSSGNYLAQWPANADEPGQPSFPYGIAAGPTGEIYAVVWPYVKRFDASGKCLAKLQLPSAADPFSIAVGPQGTIYFLSTSLKSVLMLDSDGRQVGQLEFGISPSAMTLDSAGNLYVSSCQSHEVRKYTRVGNTPAVQGKKP
jgi:sugar lactone lactonase YvrE